MASGSIIVKTSTAGRIVPVTGAKVFILQQEERDSILASRSTNRSGETKAVIIETPERTVSETPNDEKGFTTVNIRIEHPSFYTHYILGAQVFAETVSVQNVALIPLAIPTERITDRVIITPQNL